MNSILLKLGIDLKAIAADRKVAPKDYRRMKLKLVAFALALTPATAFFAFSAPSFVPLAAVLAVAAIPLLCAASFLPLSDHMTHMVRKEGGLLEPQV